MGLTHHDGVSVYGSGYYVGKKNFEVPFMPTNGLQKFDAGTVGFSGQLLSVSTRLSSIINCQATPKFDASGIWTVRVGFSGHALDFYSQCSGIAGISGGVYWQAMG